MDVKPAVAGLRAVGPLAIAPEAGAVVGGVVVEVDAAGGSTGRV